MENLEQNQSLKISAILGAASTRLPFTKPYQLQFYRHLGASKCFQVDCEVYLKHKEALTPQLVAVKQRRLPRSSANRTAADFMMMQ